MPVQLLALTTLNPDAKSALDEYLQVVGPLMESAGAKVISRYELADSIAGTNEIQYVTIIEYPDKTSVDHVFDSDEYKSLETVKALAFAKYQVNLIATK